MSGVVTDISQKQSFCNLECNIYNGKMNIIGLNGRINWCERGKILIVVQVETDSKCGGLWRY